MQAAALVLLVFGLLGAALPASSYGQANSSDMMKYHADLGKIPRKICLPPGTKEAEVRAVVLAYWRKSLSNLKYWAVSSICNALTERWGC